MRIGAVISFVLYFFLLSSTLSAQEKEYKVFYYKNGQKSSEGWLDDKRPNGYWKNYYLDGILKSEGNRVDFLLEGKWVFYDPKGKIKNTTFYHQGMKDGPAITYFTDYYLVEQYTKGSKEGNSFYYDFKERLLRKIPYKNNKEEGTAFEYDTNGLVVCVTIYAAGFITQQDIINQTDQQGRRQAWWRWYDEKDRLLKEAEYKDDLLHGYLKEYDLHGNVIKIEKYIEGVLQENADEITHLEVVTDYYPSGKVKVIASYKNNLPQGVRREFSEDGKVEVSYVFDKGRIIAKGIIDAEGKKQGEWENYYANGQLKSKGKYLNDKKVGDWFFYYEKGRLEQKGSYSYSGKYDGEWLWYYENGQLEIEEYYENGALQGRYKEYDEFGNLIVEGLYLDDAKEGKWKYAVGDYRLEGDYVEGMMSGIWKGFFDDGVLAFEGEFINDQPHGKHTYFYPNGNIMLIGWYDVGKKKGDWRSYSEAGELFLKTTYRDGLIIAFDGVKVDFFEKD